MDVSVEKTIEKQHNISKFDSSDPNFAIDVIPCFSLIYLTQAFMSPTTRSRTSQYATVYNYQPNNNSSRRILLQNFGGEVSRCEIPRCHGNRKKVFELELGFWQCSKKEFWFSEVNYDSVQSLSAVTMLLVTSMCVVILTCLCFCICFCCPCVDSRLNAEQKVQSFHHLYLLWFLFFRTSMVRKHML